MPPIELRDLTKHFGDVVAVDGLDLEIEDGEIFGFLGPNGAGKTTTIDVMLDFVRPTSGQVRLFGMDPREHARAVRQRTGVLPEGFGVYERLTGHRHVEFVIESKGTGEDPMAMLERTGIADAADRKAGGYSTGMKQRLGLAMALVGDPDLLILDEPSTGLDPNGAREMRTVIREERDRGATVFFSSHILEQVEAICDRVGILRNGRLVAEDTIEGLRRAVGDGGSIVVTTDDPEGAAELAGTVDGVAGVTVGGDQVRIAIGEADKIDLLQAIEAGGIEVLDFRTEEVALDELFRTYTQEAAP
ncbi:MAG: ATP-binding cassette domain-containing protein [Halobacteriales archaeon]